MRHFSNVANNESVIFLECRHGDSIRATTVVRAHNLIVERLSSRLEVGRDAVDYVLRNAVSDDDLWSPSDAALKYTSTLTPNELQVVLEIRGMLNRYIRGQITDGCVFTYTNLNTGRTLVIVISPISVN